LPVELALAPSYAFAMLAVSSTAKAFYVFLLVAVFLVAFFRFDLARLAIRAIEVLVALPMRAWKRSQRGER
jgi:hypothetical protein